MNAVLAVRVACPASPLECLAGFDAEGPEGAAVLVVAEQLRPDQRSLDRHADLSAMRQESHIGSGFACALSDHPQRDLAGWGGWMVVAEAHAHDGADSTPGDVRLYEDDPTSRTVARSAMSGRGS